MLLQAAVHVLVIHAPDTVFIAAQGRKLRFAAEIIQNMGKADIGRGVQQHGLSGDGQGLHGRADAAKHAVFIADVRALQAGQAVARLLPAENAVKIFIRHGKITEVRKSETLMHRLEDRRRGREAHVRDPHGDALRRSRAHAPGIDVCGNGIRAGAVEHRDKIIFHSPSCGSSVFRICRLVYHTGKTEICQLRQGSAL